MYRGCGSLRELASRGTRCSCFEGFWGAWGFWGIEGSEESGGLRVASVRLWGLLGHGVALGGEGSGRPALWEWGPWGEEGGCGRLIVGGPWMTGWGILCGEGELWGEPLPGQGGLYEGPSLIPPFLTPPQARAQVLWLWLLQRQQDRHWPGRWPMGQPPPLGGLGVPHTLVAVLLRDDGACSMASTRRRGPVLNTAPHVPFSVWGWPTPCAVAPSAWSSGSIQNLPVVATWGTQQGQGMAILGAITGGKGVPSQIGMRGWGQWGRWRGTVRTTAKGGHLGCHGGGGPELGAGRRV